MIPYLGPLLSTGGLVGGYAVARHTGDRPLGGLVLAAVGAGAFEVWRKNAGPVPASVLTAVYVLAFGASHPLAKRIGAWPSVFAVAGVVAATAAVFGEHRE